MAGLDTYPGEPRSTPVEHPGCCLPSRSPAAAPTAQAGPSTSASSDDIAGMVALPGGPFLMGTDDKVGFPNDGEGPIRRGHPLTVPDRHLPQ